MAELTAFGYHPGDSFLHSLDVRFKLVFLVLITLAGLKAKIPALFILSLVIAAVMLGARLSLKSMFKELRYFFILLLFVFIARALTTPGLPEYKFSIMSVSGPGLYEGLLVCWRLLLVVLLGSTLVATTRPSEIRAAVVWFLRPFPFIPGQRIATMMGLIIRFVPLIFDQAKETAEAQRARAVENRKNPVYRLKKLGLPLIRRTFLSADNLAVAMEARCYSEDRTGPRLSSGPRDWAALGLVLGLVVLTIKL